MWPSNIAKPLKRPPIKRSADDSDDLSRKKFEEMRSRQPIFRMPNWMSDDDDMSNLTSRMSQAPHFSTRGGPWRERRNSGGSAMSGTSEDDSVDSSHRQDAPPPVIIPIRIEAEAPPGMMPIATNEVSSTPSTTDTESHQNKTSNEPLNTESPSMCVGQLRKQPQYASRTTPAVDILSQEQMPRDTRCSSAPPDMTDPTNPRFVSKTRVTPQNSGERVPLNINPVFNNVPKPFVPSKPLSNNTSSIQEEPPMDVEMKAESQLPTAEPVYQQQQQSENQWGGHKSSIVRTIPIIVEGRERSSEKEKAPPPPQATQQQRQSNWNQPPKNQQRENQWGQTFQKQQPFSEQSNNYQFPGQQWGEHSFGSPASLDFQPDPFFDFPQHQRSNYNNRQPQFPPSESNFQQQGSQFSQGGPSVSQQEEPFKQAQSNKKQASSPPKQTQKIEEPQKHTQEEPSVAASPSKDNKMEMIVTIKNSIVEYIDRAKTFQGSKGDREYLYLDEMLTRSLIQLDNIEPDGRDDIRQARKFLIKDISGSLASMEKLVIGSQGKVVAEEDSIDKEKIKSELSKIDVDNLETKTSETDDQQINPDKTTITTNTSSKIEENPDNELEKSLIEKDIAPNS